MTAKSFDDIARARFPGISLTYEKVADSVLYARLNLSGSKRMKAEAMVSIYESIASVFFSLDGNLTAMVLNGKRFEAFF